MYTARHICFISGGYPYKENNDFVFVKKLVDAIADQGVHCSVISPKSISNGFIRKTPIPPRYSVYNTKGGKQVEVYRPRTISFSNLRVGKIKLSSWISSRVVRYIARKLKHTPDVFYGHFWGAGLSIYPVALEKHIPLFIATGESSIPPFDGCKQDYLKKFSEYVSGVICVSTKNKLESIERKLTVPEKTMVSPNGVDSSVFIKKDRISCRKKLGLPLDDFITCFVGFFIDRKGPLRVAKAIHQLNDSSIKSLFIGKGEQQPECPGILYKGTVLHENLADYLNAADVFVLPTLHEGCCNAIIEAMGCGLPIISSNLPFNDDILSDGNSIRIDPNSVSEIAEAIKKIRMDASLREEMGLESLKIAENLKIENRAKNILDFISSRIPQKQ